MVVATAGVEGLRRWGRGAALILQTEEKEGEELEEPMPVYGQSSHVVVGESVLRRRSIT